MDEWCKQGKHWATPLYPLSSDRPLIIVCAFCGEVLHEPNKEGDPTIPDKRAHRIILDPDDDDLDFFMFCLAFIFGIIIGAIMF